MFKIEAVSQAKKMDQKGALLVKLLIVIVIIGVLSAVAILMYPEQREKARIKAIRTSAKGAVPEVQNWIDMWVESAPFIALDSSGRETCYQATNPGNKSCSAYFPDVSVIKTYDEDSLDSIVDIVIAHHRGKNERNPFNPAEFLYVRDSARKGSVVIIREGARSIRISAYGDTTGVPIFETTVTAVTASSE